MILKIRLDRATFEIPELQGKNSGLLGKKNILWQEFLHEVWNTYTYLFDNLMHFYFGVYIKGEIMSVNLSKFSFALYIGVG